MELIKKYAKVDNSNNNDNIEDDFVYDMEMKRDDFTGNSFIEQSISDYYNNFLPLKRLPKRQKTL